jgi:hypothetical protein
MLLAVSLVLFIVALMLFALVFVSSCDSIKLIMILALALLNCG